MPGIKISSKVDEEVWRELRAMAAESHQSISGLLTEAIQEYLRRRRIRPVRSGSSLPGHRPGGSALRWCSGFLGAFALPGP